MKRVQGAEAKPLISGKLLSRKSQAVTEIAIFGVLVIIGFAAVLLYVQSMNAQQSLQMEAFRRAMSLSHSMSKEVSYNIVRDTPVMDVADAVGRPDLSRQAASATVMAMRVDERGDPDNPNDRDTIEYYAVNANQQEIPPMRIQVTYQKGGTQKPWISPPVIDTEYVSNKTRTGTLTRSDSGGTVTSNLNAQVSTADTTTLVMQEQGKFLTDYKDDANDYAHEASWKKQARAEGRILADIRTSLVWLLDIAGGEAGRDILEILKKYGLYNGPTTCPGLEWAAPSFKKALFYVAGLIITDILLEALRNGDTQGDITSVSIVGGYPGNIGVSGSAAFAVPAQSFSAGN
jgi:hypothetical protein